MSYSLMAGGKRIRPVLCIAACEMFADGSQEKGRRVVQLDRGAGARAPGGQVLVRKNAFRVHLISRIKSIILVHTLSQVAGYGPQIFL